MSTARGGFRLAWSPRFEWGGLLDNAGTAVHDMFHDMHRNSLLEVIWHLGALVWGSAVQHCSCGGDAELSIRFKLHHLEGGRAKYRTALPAGSWW
jgi:hypothetical protein